MVIYALISLCTAYANVDYCFVSCFGVSALSLFKKRLCLVCLAIYNRIAQSAYWNIRWNALLYSKLYIENNCEKRRLLRKLFPYIFTFLLSFLILALSCIIFLCICLLHPFCMKNCIVLTGLCHMLLSLTACVFGLCQHSYSCCCCCRL